MRAIILAAGRGVRLGETTIDRPKCLLDVGGQPLLYHSLAKLDACGVSETLVIVGHAAETLTAALKARRRPMQVRSISTPDFERRGSLGSLLTAVERTGTTSALLLESDILYDAGFLEAARSCGHSTILTADLSGSGDEVYVCADSDGRLAYLGNARPPDWRTKVLGEFAGISLLTEAALAAYADAARAWLAEGRNDAHYEEVLLELAGGVHPIAVRHCPGLPWTEVDNVADLTRAREQVWPRLAADEYDTAPPAKARKSGRGSATLQEPL
jgi:choline kinase